MIRKTRLSAFVAIAFGLSSVLIPGRPIQAQWAVFDATNYVENMLQASRMLQQITNQVQSLQNEALMLQYSARNLQNLTYSSQPGIDGALRQINTLLSQGNGISYQVRSAQAEFARLYPKQYASTVTSDQLAADARLRWQTSMEAFQQTAVIQSQVATNLTTDTEMLSELVTQSQAAAGSLQAQQATNQLIALSTKQQLQSQALMAAQFRAQALEDARNATAEEQARVQVERFLGQPRAYTPGR